MQFNVYTAFFNGEIEEVIYIDQPLGFDDKSAGMKVCRLRKALYGLKQSSRVWNKKFDTFLKTYNFKASLVDCCMYINNTSSKLIIAIWVDDGIICCKQSDTIESILGFMDGAVQITKCLLEMYIGLRIMCNQSRRILTLD